MEREALGARGSQHHPQTSARETGGKDEGLFLVAFRVLMVWAYDRSGSLLVAILMHTSLTASTLILGAGIAGVPLMTFDLIWAAALCAVVAAVAVVNGGHLSRQALRKRVA